MKASKEVKRLFVGGLGQNISQADLQSQFSRFGDVFDVEIITRKDDQGNPQKVFAYINVNITEADLRKCMSVLNKTKWKGGTLQIQLARESFLHRLAQEREEAKVKKETSTGNPLAKMGEADFHMKAVPGTEVPGHRNWVVSKFGRVLPVLHLKNQHKHKIIKYDPSKYCHNIKKIGEDFTTPVPISSLTWELEGGDDPMSKKRRGEFSEFHSPAKKIIKTQKEESSTEPNTVRPKPRLIRKSPHFTQKQAPPKSFHGPDSDSQKLKNVFLQNSSLETNRRKNSMSDDDMDSEEELRLLIAREENLDRTAQSSINAPENDPFEVVRDDFKSDIHRLHSCTGSNIKNNGSRLDSSDSVRRDNCNYDSSDTDEIIAMKKNAGLVKNSPELSQVEKTVNKKTLRNGKNSDRCVKVQREKNSVQLAISQEVKPLGCEPPPVSSSNEDADSLSESAESEVDEYNHMMKNCLRVNLTLADLEKLAGKEDAEDGDKDTATVVSRASKNLRSQKCIRPDEIVASLLEGDESTPGKQKPKENNLKPRFQAFKGIGCLYGKESVKQSWKESVDTDSTSKDQTCLKPGDPSSTSLEKGPPCPNDSSRDQTRSPRAKKANVPNHVQFPKRQSTVESQDLKVVSPASSENGTRNSLSSPSPLKKKKSLSLRAKTLKTDSDKECCHKTTKTAEHCEKRPDLNCGVTPKQLELISKKDTQGNKADSLPFADSSSDVGAQHNPAEDNLRRLAALEARQKAKELRKKLVHDALANVDGHPADKSTHIIFGSDTESETEETGPQEKQSHLREEVAKESSTKTSGKLFDSSDDEESGSDDDSNRFKTKPQFEGKAGQKLLNLQSQFGNDDRFRMDSRFLESDSEEEQEEINERKTAEEEELATEKQKALNVIQSVLNISLNNSTSKGSVATKKFKDIVRYDPTRQDHATYERKKDDKTKESKSKRKKKKEEAEKLPEVSKEMYYNIATDLKEIFQATKDNHEKEDLTPCSEDGAGESAEAQSPGAPGSVTEQPGGFTFSFFDSEVTDSVKEEAYRVDPVRPGKIAWQGTPRFQDSSSEEEDVAEDADDRMPSPEEESLPEKETTRFFFFSKTDERLNASNLFWRGVGNNTSKISWEARTNELRMDCRKKHKDAKRRVKPK